MAGEEVDEREEEEGRLVPQLRLSEDGSIVVDENSMVIETTGREVSSVTRLGRTGSLLLSLDADGFLHLLSSLPPPSFPPFLPPPPL